MRGKNILWLSLIAMLFSVMMPSVVMGQCSCRVYIDPAEIHNEDLHMPIGSTFSIDINVECVEDLFCYSFVLHYKPYAEVLAVRRVIEGDFFKGAPGYDPAEFIYRIDSFRGDVKVGFTLKGHDIGGVSGDGTLATIEFTILDVGESPLDLTEVETCNSDYVFFNCSVSAMASYYYGPAVKFTDISFPNGAAVNLKTKDRAIIQTSFCMTPLTTVPLKVRVRYDIIGEDSWYTFYCGQSFVTEPRECEYLYVDGYNEWLEWDWTDPGASVIGTPDGDYAESVVADAITSSYSFEDITLGPSDVIGKVSLEGYCRYPEGATEAVDIDVYTTAPTMFDWLGSLYGTPDWGWVSPRWIGADVSDVLPQLLGTDPTPLNNLEVLLYNYEGNEDNPMQVDALRLKVCFAQFNPIEPGEYTLLPGECGQCEGTWLLTTDDMGYYLGKATIQFSLDGLTWVTAIHKVKDFHLKIFDSTHK